MAGDLALHVFKMQVHWRVALNCRFGMDRVVLLTLWTQRVKPLNVKSVH